ncbi:glycosyltransferase family 2 protein [Cecembia sp.]|uniref:glycosyltransferase family 2 protein n=1 Tax=Cecembia sp. TaxID=1898110 RepID=UPI0025C2231F|nr:glycosyltransferase family 2 protein [Cecembia sp.]
MDSKTPFSVALIIINWNGFLLTKRCLLSLEKILYPKVQIIVVDNGSKDGSLEKLQKEFTTPYYLKNDKNLGFTGGNNLGIAYAMDKGFDYIVLLNNDTEVKPDFLEELLRVQQSHPKAGLVQPLILFQDEPDKIWSAGGKYIKPLGLAKTRGDRMEMKDYQLRNQLLDWATGCCLLIPRHVIQEVGPLENSYFAYFEDVDWSLRIRAAGYRIYLASNSLIFHEGSASSKKAHEEGTLSPTVFYLHARNQLFQLRRHVTGFHKLTAWPYHMLKYLAWMSYFCLRGRFKKMKAVAKGIHDGIYLDHRQAEPLCP